MAVGGNGSSVVGTFTIPIYDDGQDDPFQRPYLVAPKPSRTINRSYPLINFRNDVFCNVDHDSLDQTSESARFLTKHGFTAVRHRSKLLDPPHERVDFDSVEKMDEIYYPEVEEIVKKLTGCKHIFITNSALRGPSNAESHKSVNNDASREHNLSNMSSEYLDLEKPMHKVAPSPPTRIPHMDYTPLGARRAVRFWRNDIHKAAVKAGVIDAEDKICARRSLKATDGASDGVVAAEYNASGSLGPRYAAYSIWRPLKKVTRDPLVMARWREINGADDDVVMWQYEIRNPGRQGDWCRELEMLRVPGGIDLPNEEINGAVDAGRTQWYYLPDQNPDEVLVIKLFDSAALGESVNEAGGAVHGSPDIGEAAYGDARESVEVRLLAFW